MFSRRHPFLFFAMFMVGCITLLMLGGAAFLLIGAKLMGNHSLYSAPGGNVGIVEVSGPILSSKKVIQEIATFREDDAIKAIILRIDSPGGGIGPSQEIYRELVKTRRMKKVVVSMGSVAASGGYYIAAAADKIVANPGTITGSIGVIMEYANLMKIAEKIGISPVVIKSGKYKDMGSPLRELREEEKLIFQGLVDELHRQFVKDMAIARNMDLDTMAALADGRVYTAQKALSLKLVDRLGNLDDAVQWAGNLAEIKGKPIPVYPKEDRISVFKEWAQTLLKDLNISGAITDNFRYVIN